jgi:ATPase subunit of ABC transporter with duplicated ATPase domains
LQEALREYSGTVIAVSHDRYFLRQIVNRVVEVKNEELIDYVGDYNVILFSSSFSKLSMQIIGS